MTATVVIPARYGSTRFPAKILASETGRPLVQHAVDQARQATKPRQVLVATDDRRIVDALARYDTHCVMTRSNHRSGTDRVAEVAAALDDQIIVNVQGDEPETDPQTIDKLIACLEESGAEMATAAVPYPAGADPADPNLVKVIADLDGRAIYFSRSPIPHRRDAASAANAPYYLHLGIYAYRRDFLLELAAWPPSSLEVTEMLEQLRVLEHGRSIRLVTAARASHGIDTPQQYAQFVRRHATWPARNS